MLTSEVFVREQRQSLRTREKVGERKGMSGGRLTYSQVPTRVKKLDLVGMLYVSRLRTDVWRSWARSDEEVIASFCRSLLYSGYCGGRRRGRPRL
ncbi:hypothetical protein Tco_1555710 [Tanacetum coccineum]